MIDAYHIDECLRLAREWLAQNPETDTPHRAFKLWEKALMEKPMMRDQAHTAHDPMQRRETMTENVQTTDVTPTHLSKRDLFSLELMKAAVSNSGRDATPEEFAKTAVARAEALIAALHATMP